MSGTWADLIRSTDSLWQTSNAIPTSNQGMFTHAAIEQARQWQQARANEWEHAVYRVMGLPQPRKWPESLDLPRGA